GYQYGQKDIDEWTARAAEANRRAAEAGSRYEANPTPENQAAYEQALNNLGNAEQNRLEAWSKGGRKGDLSSAPPPSPAPSSSGSSGVDPFGKTGVQSTQPDGKPNPAVQPTAPMPATGNSASGAGPDVGPDIPRGLPPKPDGYQYGQKDIDEWTARAAEANRRAAEAGSRYEANPTPENQAAYEQALNNLGNAEQNRLEAWSKGGRKGDLSSAPPPSPAPSSSGSSGVDPFGKTGVQSTQPDGKPNPAVQPTAPMPATGNSASGAGPDVGPDIPRGLPPKPDGYQYGQKDIDEWTARAAEANRRAAEAGSRYEANPTPENQAAYEQALNNLGNAEQNRLEAWSKGGRKGDLSSAPPPSPAPSSSGSSGVDPFGKTGVQTTQPDGKPNPAVQPTLPLPATGGSGGASTVDPLGQTGVQTTQPDGRPNPALQPTLPLPASGGGEVGSSMVDPLGQTGLQQKLPDGRPNPALANTVPGTAGGFGGAGAGAGDVLSPAANSVPPAGLPQPAPSSGKTNPGLGLGATQGYNNLLLGLSGLGSAVKP
ncbi:hypothetical protein, partial [Rhizobium sp. AG855]|uniref:hypothetical protein n=1 Tax=Rhizobium sp. AG855 TaxID=2183898 RepID=UPI00160338BB